MDSLDGSEGGKVKMNAVKTGKGGDLYLRLQKVIDKHRSGFTHRRQRVLLDLRIGRQNALCETLNHGAWKGEVLNDRFSPNYLRFS